MSWEKTNGSMPGSRSTVDCGRLWAWDEDDDVFCVESSGRSKLDENDCTCGRAEGARPFASVWVADEGPVLAAFAISILMFLYELSTPKCCRYVAMSFMRSLFVPDSSCLDTSALLASLFPFKYVANTFSDEISISPGGSSPRVAVGIDNEKMSGISVLDSSPCRGVSSMSNR